MRVTPRIITRRRFLERLALGVAGAPVVALSVRQARASSATLLNPTDPTAKAVKYVEDAKRTHDAPPGNTCANCALYQGAAGSVQGPCQLFPGKDVKAAGWCSSWAAQM
jgi:hypothetical protein